MHALFRRVSHSFRDNTFRQLYFIGLILFLSALFINYIGTGQSLANSSEINDLKAGPEFNPPNYKNPLQVAENDASIEILKVEEINNILRVTANREGFWQAFIVANEDDCHKDLVFSSLSATQSKSFLVEIISRPVSYCFYAKSGEGHSVYYHHVAWRDRFLRIKPKEEFKMVSLEEISERLDLTPEGQKLFDETVFFCNEKHDLNVELCDLPWQGNIGYYSSGKAIIRLPDIWFELNIRENRDEFLRLGGRLRHLDDLVYITAHELLHAFSEKTLTIYIDIDMEPQIGLSKCFHAFGFEAEKDNAEYFQCLDNDPTHGLIYKELRELYEFHSENNGNIEVGFGHYTEYKRILNISERWGHYGMAFHEPGNINWYTEFYAEAALQLRNLPTDLNNHYGIIFRDRQLIVRATERIYYYYLRDYRSLKQSLN